MNKRQGHFFLLPIQYCRQIPIHSLQQHLSKSIEMQKTIFFFRISEFRILESQILKRNANFSILTFQNNALY